MASRSVYTYIASLIKLRVDVVLVWEISEPGECRTAPQIRQLSQGFWLLPDKGMKVRMNKCPLPYDMRGKAYKQEPHDQRLINGQPKPRDLLVFDNSLRKWPPHQFKHLQQPRVKSNGTAQHTIFLILPQEVIKVPIVLAAVWPSCILEPQDHNTRDPSALLMSTSPKQPGSSSWIIRGSQENISSATSIEAITAAAAKHLGVVISKRHKFKKTTITIPDGVEDRTLVMHTPEDTPGTMEIGICYLTNTKWKINGKEDGGNALILMRGAGKPGEPYNNLQITLDGTANEVASMFAYLPNT